MDDDPTALSTLSLADGDSSGVDVVTCPLCETKVLLAKLNRHIDMGCSTHPQFLPSKPQAPPPPPPPAVSDRDSKTSAKAVQQISRPPAAIKPAQRKGQPKPPKPAREEKQPAEEFPTLGPAITPKQPIDAPLAQQQSPEELRIDPADGNAYTKADFVAEYGGTGEWESAQPVPQQDASIPSNAWGAVNAWGSQGAVAGSAPPVLPARQAASLSPQLTPAEAMAAAESSVWRFSQLTLEELYSERLLRTAPSRRPPTKTFEMLEVVRGKRFNTLQGLALHEHVLSEAEQVLTLGYCRRLKDLGEAFHIRKAAAHRNACHAHAHAHARAHTQYAHAHTQ